MTPIYIFLILILQITGVLAGDATVVHVQVGKVSQVSFPENITKVIKGGSADSILVEAMDQAIYILPKTNHPEDVFVTGLSGRTYPLQLKIAEVHDINVEITNHEEGNRNQNGADVMQIMKSLLLGHEPVGATAINSNQIIMLKQVPVELLCTKVYQLPNLSAYAMRARNLSSRMVVVPVEQISFKGIKALASVVDVLNPKGTKGDETTMYMIVSN